MSLRGSVGVALCAALALALGACASAPSPLAAEWYDLGNAWLDKGDYKRAGEAYRRALGFDQSLAGASFNWARALAEAGDFAGSLEILDKLAKSDPENARILTARAWVLYKAGRAADALEAYQALIALDPYSPDAIFNAAVLKLAAGDASGAAKDLEVLVKAKPEESKAVLLLGRAYDDALASATNDAERAAFAAGALAAFEKARALGKADAAALERIGLAYADQAYANKRSYLEAIAVLDEAALADPKRAEAWFALARIRLTAAEDGTGGLEALRKALEAGFADKEKISKLLEIPALLEREKAYALLKDKGLAE
ncbi:MAG: tetratricopeptide repeat protein [Spirochaetaceae bacterium]|nr:tetratricopeptide repeat protein [Spirochaetaceae bacterium]